MYIGNNKVLKVYAGVNAVSQIVKNGQKLYEPKPNVITGKFMGAGATPVMLFYSKAGPDRDILTAKDVDIYVDDVKIDYAQRDKYVANDELEHNVKFNFKKQITTCEKMFGDVFYNTNCCLTEMDLSNFDTNKVTNMSSMFYKCKALTSLDVSNFDTSKVTDMSAMFGSCGGLTSLDLSNFDTSKVTNMYNMFGLCGGLTEIIGLTMFDTSKVTNMSDMFSWCSSLTSLDVSNFSTSQVTDMSAMFSTCTNLTSLDLSNFNTSQVTDMSNMFDCMFNEMKLQNLNLSNWNTANVTSMPCMFRNCRNLTSLDLSSWDTSKVLRMEMLFQKCYSLAEIKGIEKFKIDARNTNLSNVFYQCKNLTALDLTNWDMSKVTNLQQMFADCYKLTSLKTNGDVGAVGATVNEIFRDVNTVGKYEHTNDTRNAILDNNALPSTWTHVDPSKPVEETNVIIGKFKGKNSTGVKLIDNDNDTSFTANDVDIYVDNKLIPWEQRTGYITNDELEHNVKFNFKKQLTTCKNMFSNCRLYNELDLSEFAASQVTDMSHMFEWCFSDSIIFGKLDTSKVTDMNNMFYGCRYLTNLDVSSFDTSQVTDMSSMFGYCDKLINLVGLSNFNTNNVANMSYMFSDDTVLTSLDFSSFDTSQVTDMTKMFYSCSSLTNLDVSSFNKNKVTNMAEMFYNCSALTSLNLSNFDTSQVTNMTSMFHWCSSLTSLDVSSFDTRKVTNMRNMFLNCNELQKLDLTNFDLSNVTDIRLMFSCKKLTSLKTNGNVGTSSTMTESAFGFISTTGVYEHSNDTYNAILENNVLPSTWTHVDTSKPGGSEDGGYGGDIEVPPFEWE